MILFENKTFETSDRQGIKGFFKGKELYYKYFPESEPNHLTIENITFKRQKGIDYVLFWVSYMKGFYTDGKYWGQFSRLYPEIENDKRMWYQGTTSKILNIKLV